MMRRNQSSSTVRIRAALAVVALAIVPLSAQPPAPDGLLYARLESYLEALRQQAGIPGLSAAIVGESDIVWERGFGRQNIEISLGAQPDTPYHLDGLGQILTAALVLRCADQGKLSLDETIATFDASAPEPGATIRQLLAHTSPGSPFESFLYRPERLAPLRAVVRQCTGDSFRENLSTLFDQLAMTDSVPGIDAPTLAPPAEGVPTPDTAARYNGVLQRLATPYLVPQPGQASATVHEAATLTAVSGVVSTVRDLAKFDLALKQGLLLSPDMLATAWTPPQTGGPVGLPHGLGWFVTSHNGQLVVWQFGVSESSSSFVISLPTRRLTMILLANSDGLVKPFVLKTGVVTASPFARVFLGLMAP
jgi:CubicO group peptidase (beta-lactamase class C family)